MDTDNKAALAGLRVLDLAGLPGNYCGKMYADLGADVILIEPRSGSEVRRLGPFIDDRPGPERSLPFFYFNSNKRAHALDLDAAADRATFLELAKDADLIIESFRPGTMDAWGIGYETLRKANPKLVYVAITPFGQTGPYAQYEGDDLTLSAMSGLMSLGGYGGDYDDGGMPIVIYGNQGYMAANQFAAISSMAALTAAELHGTGEYIDVSIQEAVSMALENAVQYYDLEGMIRPRGQQVAGFSGQYEASDGYFMIMGGGLASPEAWKALVSLIGGADLAMGEELADPKWSDQAFLTSPEARKEFARIVSTAAKKKTRQELYDAAKSLRVPMGPVLSPRDLLSNVQLEYRKYFTPVWSEAAGRDLMMPRAPYLLSESPAGPVKPAPKLGSEATWEAFA